jgi:outer membrane biosynthesis protein TonB
MVAILATGCSATTTARHGDWRESVKAGDFQSAYSDLYENWRAGTPDVRAESLRYAWRDPRIVAVAKPDLVAKIQPVADAHQGDLQSLARALKDGPLEDRLAFAKQVDRKLDVDREIASAYERRRQATTPRAAVPPQPVTTPPPVTTPQPVARPQPETKPQAATAVQPMAKAQPETKPQAATAVQPMAKTQPEAKPQLATPPPPKVEPEPVAVPTATAKSVIQSDHAAQVAEAKRRAVWRCKGAPACDKAWAAAETFVGLNTDMRIRTAKSPTIETYPPIEIGKVGMKVEKVALESDESELRLTVHCRVGVLRQLCPATELRIYTAFPSHMQAAARR